MFCLMKKNANGPFSYSENECGSNDISLDFVEFSNVHNCDRSSNATQSNVAYKMYKNIARSRLFCRIAKRSIEEKCPCCKSAAFLLKFIIILGKTDIHEGAVSA